MNVTSHILRCLAVLGLAVSLTACGAPARKKITQDPVGTQLGNLMIAADLPPPENSAGGILQPLMPGDVLTVEVFQADLLNRTVQVDAQGQITLPLIDAVPAAGRTLRDLELDIEARYGARYIRDPQVSVFLKESTGQRVTVDGEVAKAGLFPVATNTTLLDAVAMAGGVRDLADLNKVYVYRSVGDRKWVANFDLAGIRDGLRANPRIFGGDVVVVFTSQRKVLINDLKDALGLSARVAGGVAAFQ